MLMNNGGLLTTNQQGNFNNDGNIWYHPKAISSILILRNVKKIIVLYTTLKMEKKFTVINKRLEGHDTIFTANKDRLYYNNMKNTKDVSMLSTVEED